MEAVLDLGVRPERIVLANCCKRPRDIRTACARGVALTTFDTVCPSLLLVIKPSINHLVGRGLLSALPTTLISAQAATMQKFGFCLLWEVRLEFGKE